MGPGVSTFASNPESVIQHLEPLLNFAKAQLANQSENWQYFPFYFKATGKSFLCAIFMNLIEACRWHEGGSVWSS
jgi:hypothetical protein